MFPAGCFRRNGGKSCLEDRKNTKTHHDSKGRSSSCRIHERSLSLIKILGDPICFAFKCAKAAGKPEACRPYVPYTATVNENGEALQIFIEDSRECLFLRGAGKNPLSRRGRVHRLHWRRRFDRVRFGSPVPADGRPFGRNQRRYRYGPLSPFPVFLTRPWATSVGISFCHSFAARSRLFILSASYGRLPRMVPESVIAAAWMAMAVHSFAKLFSRMDEKTVALYFTWHQKWRNGLRKSEPSACTSLSAFRSLHKSKIHRMGCLDCHRELRPCPQGQ